VTAQAEQRPTTIHDLRFTIHRICLIIATLSEQFEILFGVGRRRQCRRDLS